VHYIPVLQALFFLFFILSYIFGNTVYFFSKVLGVNLNFSVLAFSIIPLLLVFFFNMFIKYQKKDSGTIRILIFYTFFLMIHGFLKSNPISAILEELWTIIVVFVAYRLSRNNLFFDIIKSWGFLIFLLTSYLIYLGTNETREYIDDLSSINIDLSDRTASLGYEFISLLDFWPFIFALWFFEKRFISKLLGFIPFIVYFSYQIYFLKRAPSARCVTQLLFFSLMAYSSNFSFTRSFQMLMIFLVIGFSSYFVIPDDLISRFANDDASRPNEAFHMLRQFSLLDYIFGRGLGGIYISDNGIFDMLGKHEYRHILHIGALYPLLKGGILLFILLSILLLNILIKSFKHRRNFTAIEHSCFGFLVIFLLFRWIEGPITTTTAFNGIMFGLSLGRLEYFNQTQIVSLRYG